MQPALHRGHWSSSSDLSSTTPSESSLPPSRAQPPARERLPMPQEPLPAPWAPLVPTLPGSRACSLGHGLLTILPPAGMTRGEECPPTSGRGGAASSRGGQGPSKPPAACRSPCGHHPAALPHGARTLRAASDPPKPGEEKGPLARWQHPGRCAQRASR